jgi:hypothetical protein
MTNLLHVTSQNSGRSQICGPSENEIVPYVYIATGNNIPVKGSPDLLCWF